MENNAKDLHHSDADHELPVLTQQEVEQMYEKKFEIVCKAGYGLPPNMDAIFREYYQFDALQQLKKRLNDVKSKLNNYGIEEWSAHTRQRDPSSEIPWCLRTKTGAEFSTIAWCKIYECLCQYELVKVPQINSLHLCEAPGAFIAALNHYLHSHYDSDQIKWDWLATTLNPYYEGNALNKMITDDRFMLNTFDHWLFHKDFTGNIMCSTNIDSLKKKCEERFTNNGEVHLITADGSIDCGEMPDCQEEIVATLHFAEMIAALSILSNGGCFLIKMFTLFEATSVSKMFLLHCVFKKVHVFKPATSKRGNSEVYIICLNYKKHTESLKELLEIMKSKLDEAIKTSWLLPIFEKSYIPNDFIQQHEICTRFFMNLQIRAIEANIFTFENKLRHNTKRNHQIRTLVCKEYYRRYNIKPLPEHFTILYKSRGKIDPGIKTYLYKGSYSERALLKDSTYEEQWFYLHKELNALERDMIMRYDVLFESNSKNSDSVPLKIYRGKRYDFISSSLFISVQVLLLRQKFYDFFHSDPLFKDDPVCVLRFDDKTDHQIGFLGIDDTVNIYESQQKFFISILQNILKQKPIEIIFKNFVFSTHFAVSILFFLKQNAYEELIVTTEPNHTVLLKTPKHTSFDREINSILECIPKDDTVKNVVFCVVDIRDLHRNAFHRGILELNNLLLLKNLKNMLKM